MIQISVKRQQAINSLPNEPSEFLSDSIAKTAEDGLNVNVPERWLNLLDDDASKTFGPACSEVRENIFMKKTSAV